MNILFENSHEHLKKRAKTIYKGLKRGVLGNAMFGKVYYILPDEFDIQIDIHDETFIEVGNNHSENKVILYHVSDNTGEVKPYDLSNEDYRSFVSFLGRKFQPFGIVLWYNENYDSEKPETEELNEDNDRTRKRVKNVYHALKKGMAHENFNGFLYYELPDHYGYKEKSYLHPDIPVVYVGGYGTENCIRYFQQDHGKSKEEREEINLAENDYNRLLSKIAGKFDKFNISLQRG